MISVPVKDVEVSGGEYAMALLASDEGRQVGNGTVD